MEQCIYNIGSLRYFLTTAFGKNRQIVRETIEWKDSKGETKSDSQICDYIMTLGKKALIITIANPCWRGFADRALFEKTKHLLP